MSCPFFHRLRCLARSVPSAVLFLHSLSRWLSASESFLDISVPNPSEDAAVSSGCLPSSQGDGPQPPPSEGFSSAGVLPCSHRLNFLQFGGCCSAHSLSNPWICTKAVLGLFLRKIDTAWCCSCDFMACRAGAMGQSQVAMWNQGGVTRSQRRSPHQETRCLVTASMWRS